MTDGLYFDPPTPTAIMPRSVTPVETPGAESRTTPIDLTIYAQLIELQPVSTLANMIDLIGAELYRRRWSAYGAECRQLAKEIRTTIKYHTEQMGTSDDE